MRIRWIIGGALIVISCILIIQSYTLKREVYDAYREAYRDVLLSSRQIAVDQSIAFETTYRNAHAIYAKDAIESGSSPDLIVTPSGGDSRFLTYSEGDEVFFRSHNGPIDVQKVKEPEGEIEFRNSVCGCENSGPIILFYGSLVIGLIFIPLGLYLILRKCSKQQQVASS